MEKQNLGEEVKNVMLSIRKGLDIADFWLDFGKFGNIFLV
jgi:hypothetical protein